MIKRTRGIAILAQLGVPHSILQQWSQSLAHLTRRWEVCGQCSDPIPSNCFFPEGDVFSVVVMLGVAQCWTIARRQHITGQALLSAYADNWAWAVCKPQECSQFWPPPFDGLRSLVSILTGTKHGGGPLIIVLQIAFVKHLSHSNCLLSIVCLRSLTWDALCATKVRPEWGS